MRSSNRDSHVEYFGYVDAPHAIHTQINRCAFDFEEKEKKTCDKRFYLLCCWLVFFFSRCQQQILAFWSCLCWQLVRWLPSHFANLTRRQIEMSNKKMDHLNNFIFIIFKSIQVFVNEYIISTAFISKGTGDTVWNAIKKPRKKSWEFFERLKWIWCNWQFDQWMILVC